MSFRKYMDVSTAHIMASDNALLQKQDDLDNPVIAFDYEPGYFLPVHVHMLHPEELQRIKSYGYSDAFIQLITLAIAHKVFLIRLDGDGDDWDELPAFEW